VVGLLLLRGEAWFTGNRRRRRRRRNRNGEAHDNDGGMCGGADANAAGESMQLSEVAQSGEWGQLLDAAADVWG